MAKNKNGNVPKREVKQTHRTVMLITATGKRKFIKEKVKP